MSDQSDSPVKGKFGGKKKKKKKKGLKQRKSRASSQGSGASGNDESDAAPSADGKRKTRFQGASKYQHHGIDEEKIKAEAEQFQQLLNQHQQKTTKKKVDTGPKDKNQDNEFDKIVQEIKAPPKINYMMKIKAKDKVAQLPQSYMITQHAQLKIVDVDKERQLKEKEAALHGNKGIGTFQYYAKGFGQGTDDLYELDEHDGFEAKWKKKLREENKVVLVKKIEETDKHREMMELMNNMQHQRNMKQREEQAKKREEEAKTFAIPETAKIAGLSLLKQSPDAKSMMGNTAMRGTKMTTVSSQGGFKLTSVKDLFLSNFEGKILMNLKLLLEDQDDKLEGIIESLNKMPSDSLSKQSSHISAQQLMRDQSSASFGRAHHADPLRQKVREIIDLVGLNLKMEAKGHLKAHLNDDSVISIIKSMLNQAQKSLNISPKKPSAQKEAPAPANPNKWNNQEEDELNDSQSPFYFETPLEENDADRNRTDSAQANRARAEKAGFKAIQLLSGDQTKEKDFILKQKKEMEIHRMEQYKQQRAQVIMRQDKNPQNPISSQRS